jgi:hypothetical protein
LRYLIKHTSGLRRCYIDDPWLGIVFLCAVTHFGPARWDRTFMDLCGVKGRPLKGDPKENQTPCLVVMTCIVNDIVRLRKRIFVKLH